MDQLIETLKAQPFFALVLAFIAALIAYSIAKKLLKVLAVLSLILVLYMGYLIFKGETVTLSKRHLEKYKNDRISELKKTGPGDVQKLMDRAGKIGKGLSKSTDKGR